MKKINNTHIEIKELLNNGLKRKEIKKILDVSSGMISEVSKIDIPLGKHTINNAVIWVAGWGSRLMPVTKNTPKPLVIAKGTSFLESAIKQLMASDIKKITIVTGRKRNAFSNLIKKYNLNEVYNAMWEKHNNISSMYAFLNSKFFKVENTYFIDGDLSFSNNFKFRKHAIDSFAMTSYVENINDILIQKEGKWISSYSIPKKEDKVNGEQYKGIFLMNKNDLENYKDELINSYSTSKEYEDRYWFDVLFEMAHNKKIKMETIKVSFKDVFEVDSIEDLIKLDKKTYKSKKFIRENYE